MRTRLNLVNFLNFIHLIDHVVCMMINAESLSLDRRNANDCVWNISV